MVQNLRKVQKMARKFQKVSKSKKGVPLVYLKGSKNKKASEKEILSTQKKYKEGKLTIAEMNKIAKKRIKSGTKNYKKGFKGNKK
tara:strand:+ start:10188 stop:10442 length:255 start_codon:yes stop_codon:yes gene_type:complete